MLALILTELQEVKIAVRQVLKEWRNKLVRYILKKFKGAKLQDLLNNAKTYKEWEKYAKQLDILEGTNDYKLRNESRLYDFERIESRYRIMKQLRKGKNVKTLAHMLRQDLVKNIGGICENQLYN
jgi:hypothetical protein